MTEGKRFAQLLKEFERVGVDPNTISAGLAVREEDALRALHALPDNAGPAAFLTQLRLVMAQMDSHAPPREQPASTSDTTEDVLCAVGPVPSSASAATTTRGGVVRS